MPHMPNTTTSLGDWFDKRIPWREAVRRHLTEYYAPKNFNVWYAFGALALLMLVVQIVSGIFLTMNYKPDADRAFASVEYIMRDVQWGWLLRYIHSTGASFFFIVVYLHMFRALMYGSYRAPRELIWLLGMLIFVCMMAEAFMGYLLPWGQTSFWGAQVIVNLFSTIPGIGEWLSVTIRGDYAISDVTLNRFFALHVAALPLVLVVLVFLHIIALHQVGSNNPDGVEIKDHKNAEGIPLDGIPFHPYYSVKDTFCAVAFLCLFAMAIFFAPEMGGYFWNIPILSPPILLRHQSILRQYGISRHIMLFYGRCRRFWGRRCGVFWRWGFRLFSYLLCRGSTIVRCALFVIAAGYTNQHC